MPFSRYNRTPVLSFGAKYGTSAAVVLIRAALQDGRLPSQEITLKQGERLDVLAGRLYGDARYWWVLAAASDIGWGLQLPPGTIVKVPDLGVVAQLVG